MDRNTIISKILNLAASSFPATASTKLLSDRKPSEAQEALLTSRRWGPLASTVRNKFSELHARFRAWWLAQSLAQQFATTAAAVVLIGMTAIGSWVATKIEDGVTHISAAAAALYMDAFITPLVQELAKGDTISAENRQSLDEILALREINENVASIKVWQKDGTIAYSNFREIIGKRFTPTAHLMEAWSGQVAAHISDLGHEDDQRERRLGVELIEVYAPIRETNSNRIIAVSEFYIKADTLRKELRSSRIQSWGVVGITGALMILGLYIIVRRGSRTIEMQQNTLMLRARQNLDLRQKIEAAYWRSDRLNEQFLRRLGADLHDGPAQLLGFSLMRLDDLPLDKARIASDPSETTLEVVRAALEDAIKEIRNLSRGLILPELDEMSVNEAAVMIIRMHEERTNSTVTFNLPSEPIEASKEVKICAFRFIQEALSNAYKHAQGKGQHVDMSLDGDQLCISVSDSGAAGERISRPQGAGHQLGLVGIRDRVETLAGTFAIQSRPQGGTVVTIALNARQSPRSEDDHNG